MTLYSRRERIGYLSPIAMEEVLDRETVIPQSMHALPMKRWQVRVLDRRQWHPRQRSL